MITPDYHELELWRELNATPELSAKVAAFPGTELRLQNELRKQYSGELVRLALELNSARQKGAEKFPHADQLWLTRLSCEQATAWKIACYKAKRFADRTEPDQPIDDFCTGAGIDAAALSLHRQVVSQDLNPIYLQLASWNAELLGNTSALQFQPGDVTQAEHTGRIIHIDPDQRPAGRRQLRLEQIQPALDYLQKLAAQSRGAGIKLSPASNFGGKFPHAEVELISLQGECKVAMIWSGILGEPGLWRATVLPAAETISGDPLAAWPTFTDIQQYLYDPDPAVVRAGLVNQLSELTGLARLDDAEEYLTAEQLLKTPFATPFRVTAVLPTSEKQLRKYFQEQQIGVLEIKCRHLPIPVEATRKNLRLTGTNSATLIYAKIQGKSRAIICDRLITD